MDNKIFKRVTKKESKSVRKFVQNLLDEIHDGLKEFYRFDLRLVGSAAWNTIIKDNDNWWDLDYQILLTKKSKEYKLNELSKATDIKNTFFNYVNEKYKDNATYTVQNSTTALTIINNDSKWSVDIVIIKVLPENNLIIRRNNKDGSGKNEFTWNELKKRNEAYDKFNKLSNEEKMDLIENHILPRKYDEKQKSEDDETKLSSCQVFVEEVNNYVNGKENN